MLISLLIGCEKSGNRPSGLFRVGYSLKMPGHFFRNTGQSHRLSQSNSCCGGLRECYVQIWALFCSEQKTQFMGSFVSYIFLNLQIFLR